MSATMKRKWKTFFSQKKAIIGMFIFSLLFIHSMAANIIVNNKPLILIREVNKEKDITYKSFFQINGYTILFPAIFQYQPVDLGIIDSFVIDYQNLINSDIENGKKIFVIFPLYRWNPEEQSNNILTSPSKIHWLGTDNLGRDILSRLIYGTRISLGFSIILWLISYSIGSFLGALQGYFLGWFDFTLERFKELTTIIPMLTIIILVTAITKNQSFWMILFMVLIFNWMGMASQIRATVLPLRNKEFCEAAIALGGSQLRVLVKHIIPNSLTPLITLSPFAIEGGISLLAALDYLGFGLPPPTPSIGELMAQGRDNIQNAPWLLISPVVTILLLLISINLIGQALRQSFDPKLNYK